MEEITLENFMSHRNFHLKFNECVSFIVGENGSGKSAILVGILVCFGASAKVGDVIGVEEA
mgnify:CR=1 FL=1